MARRAASVLEGLGGLHGRASSAPPALPFGRAEQYPRGAATGDGGAAARIGKERLAQLEAGGVPGGVGLVPAAWQPPAAGWHQPQPQPQNALPPHFAAAAAATLPPPPSLQDARNEEWSYESSLQQLGLDGARTADKEARDTVTARLASARLATLESGDLKEARRRFFPVAVALGLVGLMVVLLLGQVGGDEQGSTYRALHPHAQAVARQTHAAVYKQDWTGGVRAAVNKGFARLGGRRAGPVPEQEHTGKWDIDHPDIFAEVIEDFIRIESAVGPASGRFDLMGIFLSSSDDCEKDEVPALHLNLTSATGGGWESATDRGEEHRKGFGLFPERYGVDDPVGGATLTVSFDRTSNPKVRCVVMESCAACNPADFPRRTRVSISHDNAWWMQVANYELPDPPPQRKYILLDAYRAA